MDEPRRATTLVLGLGNPILGDDGVGWRVLDELQARLEGSALPFSGAGVNITGILVMGRRGTMVQMAFTVDDEAKARAVLGLPPIETLADAC